MSVSAVATTVFPFQYELNALDNRTRYTVKSQVNTSAVEFTAKNSGDMVLDVFVEAFNAEQTFADGSENQVERYFVGTVTIGGEVVPIYNSNSQWHLRRVLCRLSY